MVVIIIIMDLNACFSMKMHLQSWFVFLFQIASLNKEKLHILQQIQLRVSYPHPK